MPDGKMRVRSIKQHNTTSPEEQLRQMLIKEEPVQVYYRTSMFLNPGKIKKKSNADKFLMQDLVFDVDANSLQEAKETTFGLLVYLWENNYPQGNLRYSGSKGFHLVIDCFFKDKTEKEVLQESRRIRDDVISAGIAIDKEITGDTRRVIGLPNTLHKNGNKREFVELNDLSSFQPSKIVALGKSKETNDMGHPPRPMKGVSADTKATRHPMLGSQKKFELGSSCLGTKGRHILISTVPFEKGLPHSYIFQCGEKKYYVCLAAMPLEQLRYPKKQSFLPVGELIAFEENKPTLLCSRGHYTAFETLGLPLPEVKEFCGLSQTKVFYSKND